MKFGWIYIHPLVYDCFCRIRYGKLLNQRYDFLSTLIESGSSFLDLCAGDQMLYNVLKRKDIDYTAIDMNPMWTKRFRKEKISVITGNILEVDFPKADYVFMGASLYQFYGAEKHIIGKMRNAAKKQVFLIEPIDRFAKMDREKLKKWFISTATSINGNEFNDRYDYSTIVSRLSNMQGFNSINKILNNRDCLVSFFPKR